MCICCGWPCTTWCWTMWCCWTTCTLGLTACFFFLQHQYVTKPMNIRGINTHNRIAHTGKNEVQWSGSTSFIVAPVGIGVPCGSNNLTSHVFSTLLLGTFNVKSYTMHCFERCLSWSAFALSSKLVPKSLARTSIPMTPRNMRHVWLGLGVNTGSETVVICPCPDASI